MILCVSPDLVSTKPFIPVHSFSMRGGHLWDSRFRSCEFSRLRVLEVAKSVRSVRNVLLPYQFSSLKSKVLLDVSSGTKHPTIKTHGTFYWIWRIEYKKWIFHSTCPDWRNLVLDGFKLSVKVLNESMNSIETKS